MGTPVSQDRQSSGNLRHEASRTSSPLGDRPSAVPGAPYVLGLVREFHRIYECATDVPLSSATDDLIELRIGLVQEELIESIAAMRAGDPLAVAQELADLAYVTAGTAVALGLTLPTPPDAHLRSLVADCGHVIVALDLRSSSLAAELAQLLATIGHHARLYEVDLDRAVAEVHRANLSKLGEDGLPIVRTDGKILKGPNFRAPDMRRALIGFEVSCGGHQEPPWWLDGIEVRRG